MVKASFSVYRLITKNVQMTNYILIGISNQAMTKSATGGHGHVICIGDLRGVFSQENTPEGHTETHKSSFFPYKQVSGRNGDHE